MHLSGWPIQFDWYSCLIGADWRERLKCCSLNIWPIIYRANMCLNCRASWRNQEGSQISHRQPNFNRALCRRDHFVGGIWAKDAHPFDANDVKIGNLSLVKYRHTHTQPGWLECDIETNFRLLLIQGEQVESGMSVPFVTTTGNDDCVEYRTREHGSCPLSVIALPSYSLWKIGHR